MIELKILGYHSSQRYALRQTVVAAQRELQKEYPELKITITEIKDWANIERYTPVISAASLVIDEELVCVGRNPSKHEIVEWLRGSLEKRQGVRAS